VLSGERVFDLERDPETGELCMGGGWKEFLDQHLDSHPSLRRVTRASLGEFLDRYYIKKDEYHDGGGEWEKINAIIDDVDGEMREEEEVSMIITNMLTMGEGEGEEVESDEERQSMSPLMNSDLVFVDAGEDAFLRNLTTNYDPERETFIMDDEEGGGGGGEFDDLFDFE